MKRKYYLLTIALCLPFILKAQFQSPEFAGINFTNYKIKNENMDGKSQNVNAFINFPIIVNDKNYLGGRINYTNNQFENISDLFDKNLTGIATNLIWSNKLNDKKRLILACNIGIYSDFKDISASDFRFGAASVYSVLHSSKLSSGVGLAFMKQFTGYQLNPLFQIDYVINERWLLSGLIPLKSKLTYKICEHLNWTNELFGNVESYRLSQKYLGNSVVEISGWNVQSSFSLMLKKHHRFTLGFGYSIRQRMSYFEDLKSDDWKIFTYNLSKKNKPVSEIEAKGIRCIIEYNFVP
jgi:hypothetical protein